MAVWPFILALELQLDELNLGQVKQLQSLLHVAQRWINRLIQNLTASQTPFGLQQGAENKRKLKQWRLSQAQKRVASTRIPGNVWL